MLHCNNCAAVLNKSNQGDSLRRTTYTEGKEHEAT